MCPFLTNHSRWSIRIYRTHLPTQRLYNPYKRRDPRDFHPSCNGQGEGFENIKTFGSFGNVQESPFLPTSHTSSLNKIRDRRGSRAASWEKSNPWTCAGVVLRFVVLTVLTYMGLFSHDLAKPTHLLSTMEFQPQMNQRVSSAWFNFVDAQNLGRSGEN